MWDRVGQLGESGEYQMRRLGVVYFHIQSFQGGSPHLCRLRTDRLAQWTRLIMYWGIQHLWGPTNIVASMVTQLDETPLYFMDDIGIVIGPPTDYPLRFFHGRWHLGTVGLTRLFDSHRERWPLMMPAWLTCVMLPGCYLARLYWFESPLHPWIWVMLVRCCHSVEVLFHHVHMRHIVRLFMTTW
jgi:hypothetical protein